MTSDVSSALGADPDWRDFAAQLADQLVATGDITDPAWAAAVAAIPRHRLVPISYVQDQDGAWTEHAMTGGTLAAAYSTHTLVTHLRSGQAVSSSTKPDLMLRMLEMLEVRDGHRVLEIGTGTGYNAALLTHRLGDLNVYSVDVDPTLVETARRRLAEIGRHPHLAARDGAEGWPDHAPFDRIIATCSIPAVPPAWTRQLQPGGLLLADIKLGPAAGNLIRLRRLNDRLEGRFTARWASFMPMRANPDVGPPAPRSALAADGRSRATDAPAQPWNSHREAWMLACLRLPNDVGYGYRLDPTTSAPRAARLTASDGSWCEVGLDSGSGQVLEAGPTPLWPHVEDAITEWRRSGQPSWEQFGLAVTEHYTALWLDSPDNVVATLSTG